MLVTKPGALSNGAPFQGWELLPALFRLRRKLGAGGEADRRFVRVLAAVLEDGQEAVEAAVREALLAGTASDDVIVNILARRGEPPRLLTIVTPEDLALRYPSLAYCTRYDSLRGLHAAALDDDGHGRAGLKGMACAFEAVTTGLQRKRTIMEVLTNLLRAEATHRHAVSVRYPPAAGSGRSVAVSIAFDRRPVEASGREITRHPAYPGPCGLLP